MKISGVSCETKFRLLVFLGHPIEHVYKHINMSAPWPYQTYHSCAFAQTENSEWHAGIPVRALRTIAHTLNCQMRRAWFFSIPKKKSSLSPGGFFLFVLHSQRKIGGWVNLGYLRILPVLWRGPMGLFLSWPRVVIMHCLLCRFSLWRRYSTHYWQPPTLKKRHQFGDPPSPSF